MYPIFIYFHQLQENYSVYLSSNCLQCIFCFFFFWKQTFKEERNYSFSRFIFCCMSSRIDLVKLNKYLSQGMFSFPQIRCAHKKILPNVMNNVTDVCHITGSLHQLILLVFTQSFWLPKAMQKLDLFTYLYYIHH